MAAPYTIEFMFGGRTTQRFPLPEFNDAAILTVALDNDVPMEAGFNIFDENGDDFGSGDLDIVD